MQKTSLFIFLFLCAGCQDGAGSAKNDEKSGPFEKITYKSIGDIPVPQGYERVKSEKGSFGEWLRGVALKKDDHVYLYNGSLKRNQAAQFAVLDISVGNKDLQQCADAVMRLRAEYLYSEGRFNEIMFWDNENHCYRYTQGNDRKAFDHYLENVFSWCGTASLEKQLNRVARLQEIIPGDVFIKGGFPGHAMIVTDVAINKEGKKVFMLAQSYMPAQDIHVVKNPLSEEQHPWYTVAEGKDIVTPEWVFTCDQLKSW
jgi:hypothetical protein